MADLLTTGAFAIGAGPGTPGSDAPRRAESPGATTSTLAAFGDAERSPTTGS